LDVLADRLTEKNNAMLQTLLMNADSLIPALKSELTFIENDNLRYYQQHKLKEKK
jgi:hypothetical protein